jgi:hypothetical protein
VVGREFSHKRDKFSLFAATGLLAAAKITDEGDLYGDWVDAGRLQIKM